MLFETLGGHATSINLSKKSQSREPHVTYICAHRGPT